MIKMELPAGLLIVEEPGSVLGFGFWKLRMYCTDTGAIAFMFNGGSPCGSTILIIPFGPIDEEEVFLRWVQQSFLGPQIVDYDFYT